MDTNVNERIAQIRQIKGLKKGEFANILGIASSVVSDIENGKREASKEFLLSLSAKYSISLNWLYFGVGPISLVESITGKKLTSEEPAKIVFEIPLLTKEQLLSFDPEKEIPDSERKANSGDYPDLTYIPVPMRVMEYSTDLRAAAAFDSRMAPVIRSGDIAIFEATGWNGSGIYLYRMGGGLHIGYVGHYGNTLHLFNEWKDVEQPYDSETFKPIGRVRAVVSDLLGKDWKGGKQPPE